MKENTAVDRFTEKINREYESMCERWRDMTADELIDNAERIAAAKFIKAKIGSSVFDDEAKYFEHFKTPLEAIMDSIMYRYDPQNIAEREWFSDHLYDLFDKRDLDADFETEDDEETESIAMQ